jgi:two-component system response regulator YesN
MRIMVVDDEPIVTTGLRALIPWEQYGFEWLEPAANGAEALEKMERQLPNLILIDCKMPVMDGLELLARIHERKWPVKSVILSGYDEFQYAQQALKLGASEYVLKPPDLDKLVETVTCIKKEWEEEQRLARQLKENLPVIRDRFLRGLLEGARLTKTVFLEKTGYLNLQIAPGSFILGLMHIEEDPEYPKSHTYEEQQLMNFAISNVAEETLSRWKRKCLFWESQQRLAIIVNAEPDDFEAFKKDCYTVVENVSKTLKYYVTIGLSPMLNQLLLDGKHAYEKAKTALEYKYYTGPNEVIALSDLEWEKTSHLCENPRKETAALFRDEHLSIALKVGNEMELRQWIKAFLQYLKQQDFPVYMTKTLCLQSMISAAHVVTELHPRVQLEQILNAEHIRAVMSTSSIEELESLLNHFLLGLLGLTIEIRKSGKNTVVESAKSYIRENFRKNLTLDIIANEVYVSPVYLSFLFKQVESVNLTDYIAEVRLDKAKELLVSTNYKTYEIAKQVGYQDEKYFSRLFKKKTGLTPSEFRQLSKQ